MPPSEPLSNAGIFVRQRSKRYMFSVSISAFCLLCFYSMATELLASDLAIEDLVKELLLYTVSANGLFTGALQGHADSEYVSYVA